MTDTRSKGDPAGWITDLVRGICDGPENSMRNATGERAWADPLVGYSRGDDPLFEAYKEHVGPEHWTPLEAFRLVFPGTDAQAGDLTVVSWVLPQTRETKADNSQETALPSERWARSRVFGEMFSDHLRRAVVLALAERGIEALAPAIAPQWTRTDSERFTYASTWSERHAAYASGLGTFGLCDGLITPVGKAMRVGSVIARMQVPATPRPYDSHRAYCLHFARGTCGECIARCPAGAISAQGHDKVACSRYVRSTTPHIQANYGFDGYGCGLCQTGVPCESRIPEGI